MGVIPFIVEFVFYWGYNLKIKLHGHVAKFQANPSLVKFSFYQGIRLQFAPFVQDFSRY